VTWLPVGRRASGFFKTGEAKFWLEPAIE